MKYSFEPKQHCDMCGSSEAQLLGLRLNGSQGRNPRSASGIAVSVKQCRTCDLIYPDPLPIPEQLSDHYDVDPETYFPERETQQSYHFDWALKKAVSVRRGMRALDVGAGTGRTMKMLANAGWDVWGIEPSPTFARVAIERNGIAEDRLLVTTVEEAQIEEGSFDLVNVGAVLEHLHSPSAVLKRLVHWLKAGGLVHVEVPSSSYLLSRLLNRYYALRRVNYVTNLSPMHPPYHLYEFSHRSFEANARAGGYELASHEYWPGRIYGLPRITHAPLRWWMERTRTGMQLTAWLRRPE